MVIREYHKGDFNAIMNLWSVTGMGSQTRGDDEATVERSIEMGGRMLVICSGDTEGNIIGTSWMTFDGRRLHLHHFGIDPAFQGQGHARELLRESLKFVKEKGYQVKLEVHRSNITAVELYRKAGFEYLGDYDVYIIRDTQSINV
jgi:ribosomal protein S18 acetylase RimI-like enzyme